MTTIDIILLPSKLCLSNPKTSKIFINYFKYSFIYLNFLKIWNVDMIWNLLLAAYNSLVRKIHKVGWAVIHLQ